jgi:hypothetical protein
MNLRKIQTMRAHGRDAKEIAREIQRQKRTRTFRNVGLLTIGAIGLGALLMFGRGRDSLEMPPLKPAKAVICETELMEYNGLNDLRRLWISEHSDTQSGLLDSIRSARLDLTGITLEKIEGCQTPRGWKCNNPPMVGNFAYSKVTYLIAKADGRHSKQGKSEDIFRAQQLPKRLEEYDLNRTPGSPEEYPNTNIQGIYKGDIGKTTWTTDTYFIELKDGRKIRIRFSDQGAIFIDEASNKILLKDEKLEMWRTGTYDGKFVFQYSDMIRFISPQTFEETRRFEIDSSKEKFTLIDGKIAIMSQSGIRVFCIGSGALVTKFNMENTKLNPVGITWWYIGEDESAHYIHDGNRVVAFEKQLQEKK